MGKKVQFPKLFNAETYEPCTFEYDAKPDESQEKKIGRESWVKIFKDSNEEFRRRAMNDRTVENSKEKSEKFNREFLAYLDDLLEQRDPDMNVIKMCRFRDECLRKNGFEDCFEKVKREENEKALEALPRVLKKLDEERATILEYVKGVFAGNIFDLGAAASQALFSDEEEDGENIETSFFETRDTKTNTFVVDDFKLLQKRWNDLDDVHRKCCIFVDNAGADIILGVLPLARAMLKRGTKVVLCANDVPSINDITIKELRELVFPRLLEMGDEVFKNAIEMGTLSCCGSGNDMPVIDLREISEECAEVCSDCDLIVLIGMGRGIETNLKTEFTIDRMNLGMVKHPEVAELLGGELYSSVCKFDLAK
jgi:damage-control phosphatase, subfamily II, stand-alone protein